MSFGGRVKNFLSSLSGVPTSRSMDFGFSLRPLLGKRQAFFRSLVIAADLLDIFPRDGINLGTGVAMGSTWRWAQFWVGRRRRMSSAGLGFFWKHIRLGYAALSGWNGDLPVNDVTYLTYVRIIL